VTDLEQLSSIDIRKAILDALAEDMKRSGFQEKVDREFWRLLTQSGFFSEPGAADQ
jgi:hypothetical protein